MYLPRILCGCVKITVINRKLFFCSQRVVSEDAIKGWCIKAKTLSVGTQYLNILSGAFVFWMLLSFILCNILISICDEDKIIFTLFKDAINRIICSVQEFQSLWFLIQFEACKIYGILCNKSRGIWKFFIKQQLLFGKRLLMTSVPLLIVNKVAMLSNISCIPAASLGLLK